MQYAASSGLTFEQDSPNKPPSFVHRFSRGAPHPMQYRCFTLLFRRHRKHFFSFSRSATATAPFLIFYPMLHLVKMDQKTVRLTSA
jgi:hypothetical protein